jgi:cysteinyl-tRNA synthetase
MTEKLYIYDTEKRMKREFVPIVKGRVGMYVCGPTVYGDPHLGHARSAITFDIVFRYLRHLGYKVRYVRNITDVGHLEHDADEGEDKIEKKARLEQVEPMEVAQYYTLRYHDAMRALNCLPPSIEPRATGHIIEQEELVKQILDNGYAYESNGSVYFDIEKYNKKYHYGVLSGRNLDDIINESRALSGIGEKHNQADFALWKKAQPEHIMRWPSPWSTGFPGWHTECTAMGRKYLGDRFDIHGGGMDLIFPHHECEIAQAMASGGHEIVNYWIHNNMVTIGGQKMGKSLGNFITLKQLFSGQHETLSRAYDPLAVRQLILQSHYRSPIDFSDAALTAAQSGYDRIAEAVIALRKQIGRAKRGAIDASAATELERLKGRFEEAMNDDLNTAVALSVIFELVKLSNRLVAESSVTVETLQAVEDTFNRLGGDVLGIVRKEYPHAAGGDEALVDHLIGLLIQQRQEARKKKDFAAADAIRNKLAEFGIVLEDSPAGTTWRRQ